MKNALLITLVMLMLGCNTDQQWTYLFNGVETLRFPVNGPEWEELIAGSGFKD